MRLVLRSTVKRLLHSGDGALQRSVGVQHDAVAPIRQVLPRRRSQSGHRSPCSSTGACPTDCGSARMSSGRGHRFDEQDVITGLGKFLRAFDGRFEALRGRRQRSVDSLSRSRARAAFSAVCVNRARSRAGLAPGCARQSRARQRFGRFGIFIIHQTYDLLYRTFIGPDNSPLSRVKI
jgi:hypothetical protein